MPFLTDSFMLKTPTARRLYDMVRDLPIIDYHCHLSPKMIAENYRFRNAYDLFLGGDHYKWRQMRTNGIDERYITGDADEYDKFLAFAQTMPYLIGNPLYHWTHLELARYFDIHEPLSSKNAREVWDRVNECLATDAFTAQQLILRSGVEVICTTDDPADTLEYHEALADFPTRILPTFRPDKAVEIAKDTFLPYLDTIGIHDFDTLCDWMRARIAYFHERGCRLSDHAMEYVPYAVGDAKAAFDKRLSGATLTDEETDAFKTALLTVCAEEYTRLGWAMQVHIGALRNNNRRRYVSFCCAAGCFLPHTDF